MASKTDETDRSARRAAIERIIAHYPDIGEDELYALLDYFRRDASALDQGMIASNRQIRPQYRQLCRDHRLDRLGKVEVAICGLFVALAAIAAALTLSGVWEF